MTLYLNFRSAATGGAVVDPYVLEGDPTASPLILRPVGWPELTRIVAGKNILFAAHGFNVSYEQGARSFFQLEPQLGLSASDVFFGVLWPGDYWVPVINYPFEGRVSMDCGRRLAAFCQRWLGQAQSLSFISHSLGARLVLEAVKYLDRPARTVCLTAAAINRDCLETEYSDAAANASAISLLASHEDQVLKLAFAIGDPISDLLHDDHSPFQKALGYDGPPTPAPPLVASPWQIPDADRYGHGDYLPPGSAASGPVDNKWERAATFMARAFRQQPQGWPGS